jgi:hypothetical protein
MRKERKNRERNQISAIRSALFEFDDHRKEVMDFFSKAARAP